MLMPVGQGGGRAEPIPFHVEVHVVQHTTACLYKHLHENTAQ